MSRHPSPGPSHPHSAPQPPRQKQQKAYSIGIAAGAEDVKYQAKYKELKRTVKEIESDNDKLHFKVLQAKRNIQRMKLERAILYEHLSAGPPSPEMRDRNPPPIVHTGPGVPPGPPRTHPGSHNREARDRSLPRESDHPMHDYGRVHSSVVQSPDVRPVSGLDTPIGPGVAPSPHSLSAMHSPRRVGSAGYEPRHLPPPSQLPPVQQYDGSRGHSHSHSHASPPLHHAHPASHERSHSYSSRRGQPPSQPYPAQGHPQQPYPDNLPPGAPLSHSPALSERERSRHHDVHDLRPPQMSPHPSSDSRSSGRTHNHQRMGPGTYISRDDPYDRGRDPERDRDWDRSRDVGRGHPMHSPPPVHRSRDYHDPPQHSVSSRSREDAYYHDVPASSGYPRISRSGTPGSGSGSNSGVGVADVPSRPDSRAQYSEHERTRSYKLRPVNHSTNEEVDFVHEDGRSHSRDRGGGAIGVTTTTGSGNNGNSANGSGGGGGNGNSSSNNYGQQSSSHAVHEQSRASMESRKRSRNEMEVDMENDAGEVGAGGVSSSSAGSGPGTGTGYPSGGRLPPEDRSSKRYHREQPPSHHSRTTEIHDDDRSPQ
ncbi:hypothetical protein BDN72DRAFT_858580 [Pluteus cervinus]|uniref:Uncharacterized protein n=1 Tax=Pluteus cervinus TaxID=181527 RepID=A0ACD3AR78_9AGAR|nr:hypothetical protein BDN72DRAFT_858580 [Pluteus cervinus]